jgi:hypothetical protein
MPMHGVALDSLEKAAELLALFFYVLTLMALVMTLAGSIGSGFVLLILGSSAHVGRAALEELVDEQRGRWSSLEALTLLSRREIHPQILHQQQHVQGIGRGLLETEAPIPAARLLMLCVDQHQADA